MFKVFSKFSDNISDANKYMLLLTPEILNSHRDLLGIVVLPLSGLIPFSKYAVQKQRYLKFLVKFKIL